MVIMVSIIKFRGGEINYLDSDATWHTLLTMQAYDETPISQHKFLPIVSLGGVDNKGISWGATIPDKEGNFYYTSFSDKRKEFVLFQYTIICDICSFVGFFFEDDL